MDADFDFYYDRLEHYFNQKFEENPQIFGIIPPENGFNQEKVERAIEFWKLGFRENIHQV